MRNTKVPNNFDPEVSSLLFCRASSNADTITPNFITNFRDSTTIIEAGYDPRRIMISRK